jgi:hypothetical protein
MGYYEVELTIPYVERFIWLTLFATDPMSIMWRLFQDRQDQDTIRAPRSRLGQRPFQPSSGG